MKKVPEKRSAACSGLRKGASAIDWVDFVKTDDGVYTIPLTAAKAETPVIWKKARSCIG